eukprot:400819-Alexandrium_andersonii.AAC.1
MPPNPSSLRLAPQSRGRGAPRPRRNRGRCSTGARSPGRVKHPRPHKMPYAVESGFSAFRRFPVLS